MFKFKHPFSLTVAGPTMCGKSYFTSQLLTIPGVIDPPPEKVYWYYGTENIQQQEIIESTSIYPIEFYQGLPRIEELEQHPNSLIVLDDLMNDVANSKDISELFTRGVHHKKLSVLLLVQNLFPQGKKAREISLNSSYLAIFKNPRDSSQINTLARQVFPVNPKYLQDAYIQATSRPFGYLLIDLTQETPETLRLMTNIFPSHIFHYFIPKQSVAKRRRVADMF
jgi:hypothetical protein